MLAFIFSSEDFSDALRRMKYMKKFREFRKRQVDQIRITQDQLQHKVDMLNAEKTQKDELLNTQVQQKQVLIRVIQKFLRKLSQRMLIIWYTQLAPKARLAPMVLLQVPSGMPGVVNP